MKRIWTALCLALCVFWSLPGGSFALNIGSPYKPGSLMIFPLVDVSGSTDTVIAITNGFSQGVNVACRWKSVSGDQGGTLFSIGPNNTVWFSVGTGKGSIQAQPLFGEKGELKCWAVSAAGDAQISWNYLQGIAQIVYSNAVWGYSSWNFAADGKRGDWVGKPGKIKLSGSMNEYDAMPKYLQFIVPGTVTDAKLTLALGNEDLTQDGQSIYSKAKFNYSRGGTSGQQCIQDWVQMSIPRSVLGSFTVQGIASTVCDKQFGVPFGTTQNSPLLGVLEAHMWGAVFGIMPIGVGIDGSGVILWEVEDEVAETHPK